MNAETIPEPTKPARLLRLPEVLSRIPYRRTRFFELVREGRLPKPVRLPGGRAVAWPEAVIDELVARISRGEDE
jgi:prophage regulatory protein